MSESQDATGGSHRSDDLEELCERTLRFVGDRAEAEVRAVRTAHGLTRFANSAIHQHVGEETVGVALKAAVDGRVASSATTRTDTAGLSALVQRTLDAAGVLPVDPDWPGLTPPSAVPEGRAADPDIRNADPAARAAHVQAFVQAGGDLRAAGYCDTHATDVAFANSAGQRAAGASTRATIDGIHQTPSSAGSAHQTSGMLADLDGSLIGERAARIARQGEDPQDIEPGRYEVVLAPECVATMLVFLAVYGFNAKQVEEDQSFVRLGEQQFDPAITIWDDATDERSIGLPFDLEGTPRGRHTLVDGGRSVGIAYDRRTAARAGVGSTGHAVPGSESWGPIAENLFLQRGAVEEDQLIAEVERGILVTTFNYCRVLDPKTQAVTGLTRNGTFLIENGEVTRPLTTLRFTQSFVEGLAPGNVLGIGSSLRYADSEFGPGLAVAPAMRLAEWNFTGGAKG